MINLKDAKVLEQLEKAGWHRIPEGCVIIEETTLRQLVLQNISREKLGAVVLPLITEERTVFEND